MTDKELTQLVKRMFNVDQCDNVESAKGAIIDREKLNKALVETYEMYFGEPII